MRTTLILAFLVASLAVAQAAWIPDSSWKQLSHNHADQQKIGDPGRDSADQDRPRAEDRIADYTAQLRDFTELLAVATGLLFAATTWLAWLTYRGVKLGRDEFVATHRPRMIVRFVQGPWTTAYDETVQPLGSDFPRARAFITVVNVGESNGTIFEYGGAMGHYIAGQWVPPGIDATAKPVTPIKLGSGQRHIFEIISPEGIYFETVAGLAKTGQLQGITILGGSIRYKDDAGIVRETAFWRTHDPTRTDDFERYEGEQQEYAD